MPSVQITGFPGTLVLCVIWSQGSLQKAPNRTK
jgi:hypothetical protein